MRETGFNTVRLILEYIDAYDNGNTAIDLTKWFHDLYRGSHRPYDPQEIAIIKEFCGLADRDFAEKTRKG